MAGTIKVLGRGKMSVKPDTIKLNININSEATEYADALSEAGFKLDRIKQKFLRLGFSDSDIKTISFNVNSEYDRFPNEDGSWSQKLSGFRCNHSVYIKFPINNNMLSLVLEAVSDANLTPEVYIDFIVADRESVKYEVIRMAINDAMTSAKMLADASNVKLGSISAINYSGNEIEDLNYSTLSHSAYRSKGIGVDITPDNIDVEQVVELLFNFEN